MAEQDGRGFNIYETIPTSYGHVLEVKESSAASGPHVWLFIREDEASPGTAPHLTLEQAIRLRNALNEFIGGVPERWSGGQQMLDDALAYVSVNDQ